MKIIWDAELICNLKKFPIFEGYSILFGFILSFKSVKLVFFVINMLIKNSSAQCLNNSLSYYNLLTWNSL